jgi:hypothetical protein
MANAATQASAQKALELLMPASGYNRRDQSLLGYRSGSAVAFARSGVYSGGQAIFNPESDPVVGLVGEGRTMNDEILLPIDRILRYPILEEMAAYSSLAAAINIHITHALSADKKTGHILKYVPVDNGNDKDFTEAQKLCDELMTDIGETINAQLPTWASIMSVFGVSYIRPYAEPGVGIVGFESSYYTLPYFIREYEIGGQLAGFAGDYIKDPSGMQVLAEPWDILPMRIPYWRPSRLQMPVYTGFEGYNLLSSPSERTPIETQNYGTSLLDHSFSPYQDLRGAIRSLKATRANAAKIDRLIPLSMAGMDPAQAAGYTRTISNELKRQADMMTKRAMAGNYSPIVTNTLLPVMGENGKGQMQFDTQSIAADINGIEDVMMYMRQLAASVGLDYTLLGWADSMSGGLGEGGFLRTAIQAAIRAQWIRIGSQNMAIRAAEIHLAHKYGKVYPAGTRPFQTQFNSLNTAIQQEEADAADSRANYASVVTTIVDAISNNATLAKSDSFKKLIFNDYLSIDNRIAANLLKEIASNQEPEDSGDGSSFMESIMRLPPADRDEILEAIR